MKKARGKTPGKSRIVIRKGKRQMARFARKAGVRNGTGQGGRCEQKTVAKAKTGLNKRRDPKNNRQLKAETGDGQIQSARC